MNLLEQYLTTRERSIQRLEPLEVEDTVVSSMPDVSPTKWHLAHTTWFFEQFVVTPKMQGYKTPNPKYAYLFNSYYVQAGERHCRAQRGLISRPTLDEVLMYRRHVDRAMLVLLDSDLDRETRDLIQLGLQHEMQHQELMLTDIKHVLFMNPLGPAYQDSWAVEPVKPDILGDTVIPQGIHLIGADDAFTFAFDNELPQHRQLLETQLVDRKLVTNREYLEFIRDGGYFRPELWLSAGWAAVLANKWKGPLYWVYGEFDVEVFTLSGWQSLNLEAPVMHVSFYEADAYARWRGRRLPTEFHWERAYPQLDQPFGSVWQWTSSPYIAYPGYKPALGPLGEYNGKFMSDQWVLRGSSFATPWPSARQTYRNFFPADTRWQFTGIRLASDV